MGGIAVDTINQTSIPGLYAVGETASTGVHGANRLASNSLLECVVYAAQLVKLQPRHLSNYDAPAIQVISPDWSAEIKLVTAIRNQLPELMWQSAGICRTASTLMQAIAQVTDWRSQMQNLTFYQYVAGLSPTQQFKLPNKLAASQLKLYAETVNLLDIGYLILQSSAFRTESRGGQYREDYPHTLDDWQRHTMIQGEQWSRS
jgi:L-aspartate oxidase